VTLIELVVTLVIIAVIAVVAIPVAGSSNAMQVRLAADGVANHLRYAQQLSITTGYKHGVEFKTFTDGTAPNTYRVYRDDNPSEIISNDPTDPANPGNNNDSANIGKLVIDFKKAPYATVTINSAVFNDGAANRTKVIFDTNGVPQADNDGANPNLITGAVGNNTVTFSRGGITRTVTVEPTTGKVTVQ